MSLMHPLIKYFYVTLTIFSLRGNLTQKNFQSCNEKPKKILETLI